MKRRRHTPATLAAIQGHLYMVPTWSPPYIDATYDGLAGSVRARVRRVIKWVLGVFLALLLVGYLVGCSAELPIDPCGGKSYCKPVTIGGTFIVGCLCNASYVRRRQ